MKRILLTMLGALTFAGSAGADQLFDAQVAAQGRQARQDAVDQAFIDTEHALKRQIDVDTQIVIDREARERQAALRQEAQQREAALQAAYRAQDYRNQLRDLEFRAQHPLVEGDHIPLWNQYDDAATIRVYLHDSGYIDLSDAQIAQVRSYMKAHGIKHVAELGQ